MDKWSQPACPFVWRNIRGDKKNLVEPQLFERCARGGKVAEMDGIETAAEIADSHLRTIMTQLLQLPVHGGEAAQLSYRERISSLLCLGR